MTTAKARATTMTLPGKTPAVGADASAARAKQAETPATVPPPANGGPGTALNRATAERADMPPASGFTLLVDGHYKNSFASLKLAKDAGAALLGRFPMLRVEIYDAANKARVAV